MTAYTRRQLVMRFSLMALAAERYDLFCGGGVAIMTILTANLGLMFASGCSDVSRRLTVTFGAVIIRQLRRGYYSGIRGKNHTLNCKKDKPGQYNYPHFFHQTAFFHR